MIIIPAAAVLFLSCSVVFTGSINGTIADAERHEAGDAGSGIADAAVYLYTDQDKRDADFDAWSSSGRMPETPEKGDPEYFIKSMTDAQGNYSFNGFIWNEFFPDYGKSGDRKEIFLLFYHEEYGMNTTTYPVYVVSDVSNKIPLYTFYRIFNSAEITGTVTDSDSGSALANVNVNIWVPESWSYTAGGNIDTAESKLSWSDSPSYTVLTDNNGRWRRTITYPMMPSSTSNRGSTIVRITYSAGAYIAENAADSDIVDGGWDQDGNGTIDPDEDDGYQQSSGIIKDTYTELGEISLADELNTAAVEGKVVNSSTNSGESGVRVQIWVAEDWNYTSADPQSIESPGSAGVSWPEHPQYTVITDAAGNYSQEINFDRKPSEADNRKTTRARLVFYKDDFLIAASTEARLTDGGWDRDGNAAVDDDESDAFLDPDQVITADVGNDLGTVRIKQTMFAETLSGEVWDNGHNELVNGTEVWLFYAPVDDDGDPATPMRTPSPAGGAEPDFIDFTVTDFAADPDEKGHFSFGGLEWTDLQYPGNQSRVSFRIYLPTDAERAAGVTGGAGRGTEYMLTAGASNYLTLEEAP